jgi:hypothetical protein
MKFEFNTKYEVGDVVEDIRGVVGKIEKIRFTGITATPFYYILQDGRIVHEDEIVATYFRLIFSKPFPDNDPDFYIKNSTAGC